LFKCLYKADAAADTKLKDHLAVYELGHSNPPT